MKSQSENAAENYIDKEMNAESLALEGQEKLDELSSLDGISIESKTGGKKLSREESPDASFFAKPSSIALGAHASAEIDINSLELWEDDLPKGESYKELLHDLDISHIPEIFTKPLELSLGFYEDSLLYLNRNFLENTDLQLQSDIQNSRALLGFKLSKLNKLYRVYISTLGRTYLIREVLRAEEAQGRKEGITKKKISFLILVRTYEKLFSFNDRAQGLWDDIFALLRPLKKMRNSRPIVLEFERLYFEKIRSLLNHTAFFLDYLYDYLGVTSRKRDKKGDAKISASFSEENSYQISDILAQISSELFQKMEKFISRQKRERAELVASNKKAQIDFRIFSKQKTFFEKGKSSQKIYSRIGTEMKGSHDWNRKELYHFEIGMMELEFCMRYFDHCYLLEFEENSREIRHHYKMNALKNKGKVFEKLKDYEEREIGILNELASKIVEEDFPYMKEAEIFLYHCTPHLLYKLLLEEFRQRQFGLAYYIDENGERWHSYPESFIKKIFISWWESHFSKLDLIKLDSYLLYSQQISTLQNVCHELYEKAREKQRREKAYLSLREQEERLWENRELIFGGRRNEIFLRFKIKINNALDFKQANQYIFQRLRG